jgi:predicted ribosomally synthesized peptide with nif11-like leader
MSPIEAFYNRLAQDAKFRTQVQGATSKQECSQIIKAAGYHFTPDEFNAYNAKLLATAKLDASQIQDLEEREMAEVLGGFYWSKFWQIYGSPHPWDNIQDQLF